jgi:hypothetical protein
MHFDHTNLFFMCYMFLHNDRHIALAVSCKFSDFRRSKDRICCALYSVAGPIQSAGRNSLHEAGTRLPTSEEWRAELARKERPCEPATGKQHDTRQPPTIT